MVSLGSLPTEDLLKIRENLDELIRSKYDADLGKRKGKGAKIKIAGQLEIEREKEFFYKPHKTTIQEMSTNGLVFFCEENRHRWRYFTSLFSSAPSTGEKKIIDCQAVRVNEIKPGTIPESETCFLILLMDRSQKDAGLLRSKLKRLLEYNPLYVNGDSMKARTLWGLSAYPEEGKELFSFINLSRNRPTRKTTAIV